MYFASWKKIIWSILSPSVRISTTPWAKICTQWFSKRYVDLEKTLVCWSGLHVFEVIQKLLWQMLKLIYNIYSRGNKDRSPYNKSLCKWGHFGKAKITFKMLLATWSLLCFLKRFRSFNAKNLESVGKRATKILTFKLHYPRVSFTKSCYFL